MAQALGGGPRFQTMLSDRRGMSRENVSCTTLSINLTRKLTFYKSRGYFVEKEAQNRGNDTKFSSLINARTPYFMSISGDPLDSGYWK
jgi:hypothetical protein